MNLTIFKKGLILVSVPLLFQLAFLGLVAEMQSSNAEAQEWYTRTKEVLSQAQTVLWCLVDGQNGIRGFILSGDPSFRRPYEAAARELPEALQQLQTFVGDNPGQLAKAGRVAAQASQLMSWYAEIDSLVRTGSSDQATARIKDGAGKRQLEAVRLEIDSFLEEERRLDGERKQALEHARQRFNGLLRAGGAVSLCTTVALAVVFSRGISGRLATLIEKAGRLARGQELSPPLAGSDEVAQLDRAFHRMATELARSGEELRKQTRILQSVLDSIGDGVNVADEQGRFLVFNPAAEQIL